MSKETNIAAQQKFGEAINANNLETLNDLVSSSCVEHDPAPGQEEGPQGYINFFTTLRTAFSDMKIEVKKLVADEDSVAFAYELTGTHDGTFQDIAPTGKRIKARGLQISRFEDGKMVERWGSSDELGILNQIGLQVTS